MAVLSARVDRMKEAKSEAEQIIAAYKAEMEANYQRNLATVSLVCITCVLLFEKL